MGLWGAGGSVEKGVLMLDSLGSRAASQPAAPAAGQS